MLIFSDLHKTYFSEWEDAKLVRFVYACIPLETAGNTIVLIS